MKISCYTLKCTFYSQLLSVTSFNSFMIIEIEKHISVDVYTNRKTNFSFSTYFIFDSLSFHSSTHSNLAKNCSTCIQLDESTDIDRKSLNTHISNDNFLYITFPYNLFACTHLNEARIVSYIGKEYIKHFADQEWLFDGLLDRYNPFYLQVSVN